MRGVPADCAHIGFFDSDDWEFVDGEYRQRVQDPPRVWMGILEPDTGEPISPIRMDAGGGIRVE